MKAVVSKAYGEKVVFEGLELQLEEGEVTCILGASGVGKTTLLNILAGLTDFTGELTGVPERVGYAFQTPRLLPNLTVEGNLIYAGAAGEYRRFFAKGGDSRAEKQIPEIAFGRRETAGRARAGVFVGRAVIIVGRAVFLARSCFEGTALENDRGALGRTKTDGSARDARRRGGVGARTAYRRFA